MRQQTPEVIQLMTSFEVWAHEHFSGKSPDAVIGALVSVTNAYAVRLNQVAHTQALQAASLLMLGITQNRKEKDPGISSSIDILKAIVGAHQKLFSRESTKIFFVALAALAESSGNSLTADEVGVLTKIVRQIHQA